MSRMGVLLVVAGKKMVLQDRFEFYLSVIPFRPLAKF